jgi:uncharacterized protein YecT (DUF1311 family)
MMVRLVLGILVLGCISTMARAQWAPPTSCDRFGGYEAQTCLNKAITEADRALNAAYQRAQAYITADTDMPADQKPAWQANLVKAQRAWIAYRDANCLFELIGAEWDNRSGTTAAQQACVLDMTQRRAKELTERYTSN